MPSRYFPPAQRASSEGLVAVGGRLSTSWLLDAYRHGIFPWPSSAHEPMLWWSPDPRAILPLDGLHVSRRLARRLQSAQFDVTCDTAFAAVIEACASGPGREEGTWITPAMIAAYTELHRQGHAHSVEAWQDGELAGGVYGLAVGGLFAAESMFYRARDGSKVALARLVKHLTWRGFQLLDVQQATPHTESLGVVEISRRDYLRRLAVAVEAEVSFGDRLAPWDDCH
jgi:leucyl/phenylalanyl-tRNA--protein transferase